MERLSIAVVPGDGIGMEVMREARAVLTTIAQVSGNLSFDFSEHVWGCEYYLRTGKMMPEDGMSLLADSDAILLGAVGFPGVPDHVSLRDLLLRIRQGFDQYVNFRPVLLLDSRDCPLKQIASREIDIAFVRENTEGEYSGIGGRMLRNTDDEVAFQTAVFTRRRVERVMRYAFELALERVAHASPSRYAHRPKVTSVTKSNALNHSMVFWDEVFAAVCADYPDVATEQYHVDAMSMYLIQRPADFDVIVASNLFGDILTDLGGILQGGLGLAAGANLNPERKYPSMFEPVHGSAPTIAGRGIANPLAMIWTVKLMLDFLGHRDLGELVLEAIEETVVNRRSELTPDMGGTGTTRSVGEMVAQRIRTR